MDYYGSVKYPIEKIKTDLIQEYNTYSKEYISNIIDYLYRRNLVYNDYSYSGWSVFHAPIVINKISKYIKLDTLICKKKLLLMRYLMDKVNNNEIIYEPGLFEMIGNYIPKKFILI